MCKDFQFIYRLFTYKSPNITLGMSMHSSDSRKAVAELIFWYWNGAEGDCNFGGLDLDEWVWVDLANLTKL
jgi:hypothetical protein